METVGTILGRSRRAKTHRNWKTIPQPYFILTSSVPLVRLDPHQAANSDNVNYLVTGITAEAEEILSQLPIPLYHIFL
jgi:hypothetical protein